jgi:hypothetical protein
VTEAEWEGGSDPDPMLGWLQGRVSDRKLRWWAALSPSVRTCPAPGMNCFRQFHAALVLMPNQCFSAAALSVRMARIRSSVMSNPEPPWMPSCWHRGHGTGASVQLVTRQSARRYLHRTMSPGFTGGGM